MARKKTFRTILGKPSSAIQAMVDGLRQQAKRKNFKIDMATYGEFDDEDKVCFGCAATCTVQRAMHKTFRNERMRLIEGRADILGADVNDLSDFENAIDNLRVADIFALFEYFRYDTENDEMFDYLRELEVGLPVLSNGSWKKGLREYAKLAKKLQKDGY